LNILVTGSTGFIGSHLADRLSKVGHHVTVPVREKSNLQFIASNNIDQKSSNLKDYNDVCKLIKRIDVVFHLASIRGSGWTYTDEQIWDINLRATENLLKASTDKLKHFIYISSVSVHGHLNGKTADEDYPYSPVTRYGRTKYESEMLVKKYQEEKGLNTTIIRPVITYGPRDTWGMIPKLIRLINSKRYLTVGRGENRVHLIYIDDLIDGLVLTINRARCSGETFILAGERPITINSLVRIVESTLKKGIPKIHVPLWFARATAHLMEIAYKSIIKGKEPFITRDKIDIMTIDRAYDIGKAKEVFGFSPGVDYEYGLSKTIHWLKEANLIP
jgi:nucleoside-diphosphate-sugar epimerase